MKTPNILELQRWLNESFQSYLLLLQLGLGRGHLLQKVSNYKSDYFFLAVSTSHLLSVNISSNKIKLVMVIKLCMINQLSIILCIKHSTCLRAMTYAPASQGGNTDTPPHSWPAGGLPGLGSESSTVKAPRLAVCNFLQEGYWGDAQLLTGHCGVNHNGLLPPNLGQSQQVFWLNEFNYIKNKKYKMHTSTNQDCGIVTELGTHLAEIINGNGKCEFE